MKEKIPLAFLSVRPVDGASLSTWESNPKVLAPQVACGKITLTFTAASGGSRISRRFSLLIHLKSGLSGWHLKIYLPFNEEVEDLLARGKRSVSGEKHVDVGRLDFPGVCRG